ncbi:MAG TPA: hypothetical protein VFN51_00405 [Candidatus Saccharimonadales bacterium]|nr:hypothetical protein [Candidatus Saccharimonadales bacterium]
MDSSDIDKASGEATSNPEAIHESLPLAPNAAGSASIESISNEEALHGLENETDSSIVPSPLQTDSYETTEKVNSAQSNVNPPINISDFQAPNSPNSPQANDSRASALFQSAHALMPGKKITQLLPSKASPDHKRLNWHFLLEAILISLIILLAFWGASAHSDNKSLQNDNQKLQAEVANPQQLVQQQNQDLINKVGMLTKLPTGETPTIAGVANAAAARQQSAFFDNAQNGDKVLMYEKAGEAVLYRPSTNKVILVAPMTITNSSTPATTLKK